MLGVIGIIISLLLLMYLAYKGLSVIAISPLLAVLAAALVAFSTGGDLHLMATYTQIFMQSVGNFIISFFPIFLLGAVLGKFLEDSGSANSIAEFITTKLGKNQAILAVMLTCAVLTYGGVSLFVVVFAAYPIGVSLFREAGIPKRLLAATIALGAFTFTMTALPGSPQIQNAIPMTHFGTDAYAAPVLGIVASLIMAFGGLAWLNYRAKSAMAKGEGYGDHKDAKPAHETHEAHNLPNVFVAFLPIIVVLVVNLILSKIVYPSMDLSYLETELYHTTAAKVIGNWSLILSLIAGILTTVAFNYKRFKSVSESLTTGVNGSFLAIFNTASETGYGNVIKGLASFAIIKEFITTVSSNPLINEAISVSVLAGITGSASGGLSIALGVLAQTFLDTGVNPQVLHRVASVACGGLDTLPHNGAVITLLGITGLTHKSSYVDIAMCTVVIPTIAVITIIVLSGFGIV